MLPAAFLAEPSTFENLRSLLPVQGLQIDIAAAVLLLFLLAAFKRPFARLGSRIQSSTAGFAARPFAPLLVVFLLAVLVRVAVLPWVPVPYPSVHDECSYLLGADTFASGRLTNPTPASAEHFDTMHIVLRPTYQSVYMPGQALFLGLGKALFGHPWAGVLLSVASMCACFTWALRGWVSPGWALFGGVLAILRFGVLSYWVNSYWGGAVAAIGGALLLGAYPRLRENFRWSAAAAFGAGLVVLALTRPFEGLVFCTPIVIALVYNVVKQQGPAHLLLKAALPGAAILLAGMLFLSFYCWRVTGSPTQLPHFAAGGPSVPAFWLKKAVPISEEQYRMLPEWRSTLLRWNANFYQQTRHHPLLGAYNATVIVWAFQLSILLTLPLVLGAGAIKDSRVVIASLIAVMFGVYMVSFAGNWSNAHYTAPGLIATYILLMKSMQGIRSTSDGPATGSPFAVALMLVCVGSVLWVVVRGRQVHTPETWGLPTWSARNQPGVDRQLAEQFFIGRPGKHLVLVKYAGGHQYYQEYVYNGADLQRSRIIWARSLGEAADQELFRSYPDREVWIFRPDEQVSGGTLPMERAADIPSLITPR